ncbi:MAG: hypothetical protein ACRDQ5_21870 [Sciscionella sp.]
MMIPDLCVDDDEQFDDVDLPEVFTRPQLDTDADAGALAAQKISALHDTIADAWCALELIERALRVSERTSERARVTRLWVREALGGLEHPVFRGLDEASVIIQRGPEHSGGVPPEHASKRYEFRMPSAVTATPTTTGDDSRQVCG